MAACSIALCRRKPLRERAGSLGTGQRGPENTYHFSHPLLSLGRREQARLEARQFFFYTLLLRA